MVTQSALVTLPGVLVGLLFALCLGHRNDYLGHYLAGLGGTLGATLFVLYVLPSASYQGWAGPAILAASLACICMGAVAEATVFNFAKFDELDFGSQSVGAVVAALSCQAAWKEKPGVVLFAVGAVASLGFFMAGFHYAFAR